MENSVQNSFNFDRKRLSSELRIIIKYKYGNSWDPRNEVGLEYSTLRIMLEAIEKLETDVIILYYLWVLNNATILPKFQINTEECQNEGKFKLSILYL